MFLKCLGVFGHVLGTVFKNVKNVKMIENLDYKRGGGQGGDVK